MRNRANAVLAARIAAEFAAAPDDALGWYVQALRRQAVYLAADCGMSPAGRESASRLVGIVDDFCLEVVREVTDGGSSDG